MSLSIKHPETERLARELAKISGASITEAVHDALSARLEEMKHRNVSREQFEELNEIALHCASLPVKDDRPADEILGYDDNGAAH